MQEVEPSIIELIDRIDSALAADDVEVSSLKKEVSSLETEVSALKKEASAHMHEIDRLQAIVKAIEVEKCQAQEEAQREAELTLSQLHESQKELHRYYLLCQKQASLLNSAEEIQARSFALLAKVNQ